MRRWRIAASRSAAAGFVTDDEPLVLAHLDLLDPQVVAHLLVAALAGQRGLRFRGARAQLLAQDVAGPARGEVAAVLGGGEAAVGHPDDLRPVIAGVLGDLLAERPESRRWSRRARARFTAAATDLDYSGH